jgi:hypothetical protein
MSNQRRSWTAICESLEASPGIEPGYTDLQSAASPFRHEALADPLPEPMLVDKASIDASGEIAWNAAIFRR